MKLDKQVALVTGAASGFGAAIAHRMAEAGAAIMVADLNAEGAQAMAQSLQAKGHRASWVAGDVADERRHQAMVERCLSDLGGLHIVVNNAGTTHRNQPALEVSEADFDRVFRVNLKSLFWSAKFAVPHLVQQGFGAMVNVASITGVRPGPGLTWYSGSKAAMINITKGLAQEFSRAGVRINAVSPMIGETPLMSEFMGMPDTPENRERFLARIPMGRFTQPHDVASAVTFLASDEASFLTGVCLDVDGGRNI